MKNRIVVLVSLLALLAVVLLGCTMRRGGAALLTPTPTKTPRPLFTATHTPTLTPVPTDTPLPTGTAVPPTDTPAPTGTPLPTDTPSVPTEAPPTGTAVPPTDTPSPPTNTPPPRPTNTPAPPTNTPKPKVDFRVVEQRLLPKAENQAQLHSIFIQVVDAARNPLHGPVVWDPNHPDQEAVTGSKPDPYSAEYQLWSYDAYQFEVKGANSEKTKVLSTEVHLISKEDLVAAGYCSDVATCNQDDLFQHYSWFVTFQRTW
jgi:hypothetical protein